MTSTRRYQIQRGDSTNGRSHHSACRHTLFAATVNGALGYGFSSLTVPVALFFLTNRVLNPALVPIEVVLNAYVLWLKRASVLVVWRRVMPIVIALAPAVVVGTALVTLVNADWLKFITYFTLLPLILLQAAGFRRPIQSERAAGYAFGGGLGVLYSMTTISGPPLAVALSNQGLAKQKFPRGARRHPSCRIEHDGRRLCVRGPLLAREHGAHSTDSSQSAYRCANRRS